MLDQPTSTILIVDDAEHDREIYRQFLSCDRYQILEVNCAEDALILCTRYSIDAILIDYRLPDMTGIEFLEELKSVSGQYCPSVIMITRQGNESIAVQALKMGAEDYLVKYQMTPDELRHATRIAIENAKLRRQLQQSETRLEESQYFIQQVADTVPSIIYIYDLLEQRNIYVNNKISELLGYTPEEIRAMGENLLPRLIHPDDVVLIPSQIQKLQATKEGEACELEYRLKHGNGEWRWFCEREVVFKRTPDGWIHQILGIAQDVTQRKQVELSLQQVNERFEYAASAVNCLIYDLDFRTGHVERTRGLYEVVGYHPEEAEPTTQWWHDRIHPEDLARFDREEFDTRMQTEDRIIVQYRVRHKQGHYVWVKDQGFVVRDQHGTPIRFVGSTTDITEQKQAETELRESEALFRGVFESELIGILFWHLDGPIMDANEAFIQMLGYSREDLKAGKVSYVNITPPEYQAQDAEKIELLLQTGYIPPFEKEYIRKDGTRLPILLGCAFLPGNRERGVGFVLDISERKRLEQERERLLQEAQAAREEAIAANRSKDGFLAMVSHELRSPLNTILGWAKLLRSQRLDPDTVENALTTIERNALVQSQLIEDLLDVSRMIHGTLRINLEPVNLMTIVETAVMNLQPSADAKQIELRTQMIEPGSIIGDANRLQQVLTNLLTNAIKFTPRGGSVNIKLSMTDSIAEVIVHDTGKGIAPEFLPHIFDQFQQAEKTTGLSKEGLGLGLAIVRHIVELHGGTILAESPGLGLGATFTVRLPLRERPLG